MGEQAFGQEIVDTYRAWDEFSRRGNAASNGTAEEGSSPIIDIDIAPQAATPLHFETNDQVQAAIEDLLERSLLNRRTLKDGDFIAQKLEASLQHVRLLTGDQVDFGQRVETAMGITPELVDEGALDDHRDALDGQLKPYGLRFDTDHYEAFSEQLELRETPDQTRARLLEAASSAGKTIFKYTREQPLVTDPELVEADMAWIGWFGTGENGKPFFKMNAHPRHKHTPARIGSISLHEEAHATQAGIWQRAIARGDMSPALGILTMHTPEMTQFEAYAQLIEQLGLRNRRGPDSWQYRWQADYHDYRERVYYNAHVMANSGCDQSKVEEHTIARLPFSEPDTVRQDIADGLSDPALVSYFACYQPGFEAVRPVLYKPFEQQRAVIAQLGSQPLTLDQMRTIASAA